MKIVLPQLSRGRRRRYLDTVSEAIWDHPLVLRELLHGSAPRLPSNSVLSQTQRPLNTKRMVPMTGLGFLLIAGQTAVQAGKTEFCKYGSIEKVCFREWPTQGMVCPNHVFYGHPYGFIHADHLAELIADATPPCRNTGTFGQTICDFRIIVDGPVPGQYVVYAHLNAYKTFDDGNPVYSYGSAFWLTVIVLHRVCRTQRH